MGRRRVVATVTLAVVAAAGCTSDRRPGLAPPPASTSQAAIVERPHFAGDLPVVLEAGTSVYADQPCSPDPARHRICSADGSATWLTYPGREAHLVEAEMTPTDDSTAWVVTLTFDSAAPHEVSRRALSLGAALLVVADDAVLVAHRPMTVPTNSVRGHRVRLEETDKATAWDLVESLVEAL